MEHGTDIATIIQADHREVEALFDQLDAGTGDRKELALQVSRLLSPHAVAEEQVLYPALRGADDGDLTADHAIQEHGVIKDALTRLERLDADSDGFGSSLTTVMEQVRTHVHEEENDLLPRLRAAVGDDRMRELGEAFEKAKGRAPTHPHPHAPSTPPANLVAGAVAAPIDKLRDKITGKD